MKPLISSIDDNASQAPNLALLEQRKNTGRWILIGLIMLFALPPIIAKTILSQHWYQPGVTNKGVLIEPRITFADLGIPLPGIPFPTEVNAKTNDSALTSDSTSVNNSAPTWYLGYVLPQHCQQLCQQQLHLLKQSYTALGKYQPRVTPTVFIAPNSDTNISLEGLTKVSVNNAFLQQASSAEYLISDPLGQLVMKYPTSQSETELVVQHKGLLADLRKLLKLSRVG